MNRRRRRVQGYFPVSSAVGCDVDNRIDDHSADTDAESYDADDSAGVERDGPGDPAPTPAH